MSAPLVLAVAAVLALTAAAWVLPQLTRRRILARLTLTSPDRGGYLASTHASARPDDPPAPATPARPDPVTAPGPRCGTADPAPSRAPANPRTPLARPGASATGPRAANPQTTAAPAKPDSAIATPAMRHAVAGGRAGGGAPPGHGRGDAGIAVTAPATNARRPGSPAADDAVGVAASTRIETVAPAGRAQPGRGGAGTGAGGGSLRATPGQVLAALGGGVLALVLLVAAVGPLVLVVGALAAGVVPVARRRARRFEGRRLRRDQLPAALERLATALRAGSSVPAALVDAGASMPPPIGPELAALGREAAAGRATVDVLDAWSARHDDAGTRLAATALTLATTVGGAPGRTVDGVATTLRERVDLADERRALASQARVSALVLAVAPVGFAVLLGAADGAAASFLLGTPAGWACLGAGLTLDGLGAWWMARLTAGGDT